jgi:succinate dehydrogenase / fumarate reductase cytochrome b subunit
VIISGSMPNAGAYPYNGNIRYTLQRATGMIVFAFIILHVWQMHKLGAAVGGGRFDAEHASSTVAEVLTPFSWQLIYGAGLLCAVFHLANGLWTAGITWGIWTTPAAMRRAGWISLIFGLMIGAAGFASIVGFATTDVKKAQVIEGRMEQIHQVETGAEKF